MSYTSFADMANDIRRNAWKVPADVDIIVGVPRSGLLAALMLGEVLNKPVIDLDGFVAGREPQAGSRSKLMRHDKRCALILDDTVYSGGSMKRAREKAQTAAGFAKMYFGCVYAEGRDACKLVDVFFVNNYNPHEEIWHLYEWNILHHGSRLSSRCMFDIDGVLCKEPPDERFLDKYLEYIANAVPMVIPTTEIGALVSFRLEQYRDITEQWLKKQGVMYGALHLCPARNYHDRSMYFTSSAYKAGIYRDAKWALLFIESDRKQAQEIARLAGKQVFCYEGGKMY